MKISELLDFPSVKILIYLSEKGQVHHSDLEKLLHSRGTLGSNLNDLLNEGLVARKVIPTKPIVSNYSLTAKGRDVSKALVELQRLTEP